MPFKYGILPPPPRPELYEQYLNQTKGLQSTTARYLQVKDAIQPPNSTEIYYPSAQPLKHPQLLPTRYQTSDIDSQVALEQEQHQLQIQRHQEVWKSNQLILAPGNSLPSRNVPATISSTVETCPDAPNEYKPFISKLGYLLRSPEIYSDVIQWNDSGTAFILAPSSRFSKEVLPQIFSHSSIPAFYRQLNTYAFIHLSATQLATTFSHSPDTTTSIKELSAWSHPLFCRDQPALATQMRPVPSRARAAHQLAKQTMLMENGTSYVGKIKAPIEKKKIFRRRRVS